MSEWDCNVQFMLGVALVCGLVLNLEDPLECDLTRRYYVLNHRIWVRDYSFVAR